MAIGTAIGITGVGVIEGGAAIGTQGARSIICSVPFICAGIQGETGAAEAFLNDLIRKRTVQETIDATNSVIKIGGP